MSEITLIHTSYRAWGEWIPESSFLNLETQEKNDWGRGTGKRWDTRVLHSLPLRHVGNRKSPREYRWGVGRLVVCRWKSRLMVSLLGSHLWSRMDTGGEEGSHYKYRVLSSEQTSSTRKCMCQLSRQNTVLYQSMSLRPRNEASQPPSSDG